MTTNRGISRAKRDEELALAIASGLSYRAAARAVGISLSTVQRRVKDPAFQRQVEEFRRGWLTATNNRIASHGPAAADTLAHLMQHADSENVRARAAQAMLSSMLAYHAEVEHEERLREIEKMLGIGETSKEAADAQA
jgi:hypothetical protein